VAASTVASARAGSLGSRVPHAVSGVRAGTVAGAIAPLVPLLDVAALAALHSLTFTTPATGSPLIGSQMVLRTIQKVLQNRPHLGGLSG